MNIGSRFFLKNLGTVFLILLVVVVILGFLVLFYPCRNALIRPIWLHDLYFWLSKLWFWNTILVVFYCTYFFVMLSSTVSISYVFKKGYLSKLIALEYGNQSWYLKKTPYDSFNRFLNILMFFTYIFLPFITFYFYLYNIKKLNDWKFR